MFTHGLLRLAFLFSAGCAVAVLSAQAAQSASPTAEAASPTDSAVPAPLPITVSPGPYYVGAVISASIVVPTATDRPQLNPGQIRDFEARVFDIEPLPESAPQKGFVIRLNLLPKKPGQLRVPALMIGGASTRRITEALTLDVAEPEPASDMSLVATLSEPTCYVGQPVTLEVTWTLGSDVTAIKAVDLRVPLIDHANFKSRDFASVSKDLGQPIGLPVSNGRVIGGVLGRTIRFRKIVVPQKPGNVTIPGAAVLCSVSIDSKPKPTGLGPGFQYAPQYDNQFFSDAESVNARRLFARSAPLKVRVRPLPEAGKPADFSGVVGALSLTAAADPSTLREGEPLTFTLRVRDYAYPEVLELPPFGRLPGFRGRFRIPTERAVPTLEHTERGPEKIFRQSFRPISTGVDKIPAINLSFFDPVSATYRSATAPEIALRVLPHSVATGFDAVLSDGSRLKNILVSNGPGIGPNFSPEELLRPSLATWVGTAGFWWAALGVPPLACALLVGVTRRWRCRRFSPERERTLWAYPDFLHATRRVTDPIPLTRALHTYLGRRLGIAVVTFGAVEARLREQGVTEIDLARLREVLESGDHRDFSLQESSIEPVILSAPSLRGVVSSIEAALGARERVPSGWRAWPPWLAAAMMCLVVLPLRAEMPRDALGEAEAWFRTGVEQRFDNPEAAKDAFDKAAAGFEYLLQLAEPGAERGKLHYNSGAARFFGDDFGRAVYHFRVAQRWLPADRRIQSALAFVRSRQPELAANKSGRRFWDLFLPLREMLNPASRKLMLAAFYVSFWILVGMLAFRPSRGLRRFLAVPLLICAGLSVSLVADGLAPRLRHEGVVLEAELVARRGPAAIYEPAFETPIHAGAEFRVLGQRYDWLEIRIPGTAEPCWIPANSARLLDP